MTLLRSAAAATAALGLLASSAAAGGMAPPVEMAPVEIIEDTGNASSSAGLIIPLILVALIAAAVSAED